MHHLPAGGTLVIFHFMTEVELQVLCKILLHFGCEDFTDECCGDIEEKGLALNFFNSPGYLNTGGLSATIWTSEAFIAGIFPKTWAIFAMAFTLMVQ